MDFKGSLRGEGMLFGRDVKNVYRGRLSPCTRLEIGGDGVNL
jgi:hypothetical protein